MDNFQKIAQNVGVVDAALREQGRKHIAAAGAQIALPEQIERLNQQTGNLLLIAEKADAMTRGVVRLTWALVVLTGGLLFFTAYLCYDIYQHRQHDNLANHSTSEQR